MLEKSTYNRAYYEARKQKILDNLYRRERFGEFERQALRERTKYEVLP